jgi:hypothetical protein
MKTPFFQKDKKRKRKVKKLRKKPNEKKKLKKNLPFNALRVQHCWGINKCYFFHNVRQKGYFVGATCEN